MCGALLPSWLGLLVRRCCEGHGENVVASARPSHTAGTHGQLRAEVAVHPLHSGYVGGASWSQVIKCAPSGGCSASEGLFKMISPAEGAVGRYVGAVQHSNSGRSARPQ